MDQPLLILWMPTGSRGKVVYGTRLYTPERFFHGQTYQGYGRSAYVVQADMEQAPRVLTKKRIQELFPQFINTPYAKAALRGVV